MKKKSALVILVLALAIPLSAETWKNVSLMDAGCGKKAEKIAKADEHSRSCAMRCGKGGGYGAVVDGKFVKFDAKGDELAAAALEKSEKKDHLRANVEGTMKDGVLHVSSLDLR